MNPSEEATEMAELHLPFNEYCFAYVDEDLTIHVSTKEAEPIAVVGAFVSYMKAVGFSPEEIESALFSQSIVMKTIRVPSSILDIKR